MFRADDSVPVSALRPKWTYSCSHYHYLRQALPKRAFYEYAPSGASLLCTVRRYNRLYAEYRLRSRDAKAQGQISDQRRDRRLESLRALRGEITDLDADVLDILTAYWLDRRRAPEGYVEVDTDEILFARGLSHKVNGQGSNADAIGRGYTPSQRAAANRAVCRVLMLWADVKVIHTHDADPFVDDGWILEIPPDDSSDVRFWKNHSTLPDPGGSKLRKRRTIRYRVGSPLRHFDLPQRMYQPPRIASYNYRQHRWEKRLARYLFWQWRVNRDQGIGPLRKDTSSLLNAVLLDTDADRYTTRESDDVFDMRADFRPADPLTYRTRTRFEKALDRLDDDDLIGEWDYVEGWDPDWSRKINWGDLWRRSTVLIKPAEHTEAAYESTGGAPSSGAGGSSPEKALE